MNYHYIIFYLFLLNFIVFSGCIDRTPTKQPEIYKSKYKLEEITQVIFEPSSYTFDTLNKGSSLKGSFLLKNVGRNILIIDSFSKACSCTTLDIPTRKIGSGDSVRVSFIINPQLNKDYFVTPIIFYLNTKPFYREYLIEGYIK